jgi:CheY-like chemotaxis protein/HPt (histidine-containing phosphotransfer) domain-containing protein
MLPRDTASPAEALAWIQAGEPFDVAILDMQMPDMDGVTLANQIHHHNPRLPLLMLTSLGRREVRDDLQNFAAFLSKPVKPSQLFNALVAVFSGLPLPVRSGERQMSSEFDPQMGQHNPLHILLAEDHPTNQKLALRLLERLGYRADVAANGLEVLDAIDRQRYDVVLMDMQMPEMDGLEATRRIRVAEQATDRPTVYIVAMTANAMQGDRDLCLAAGMNDYVSKPIRVEALVRALSNVRSQADGAGSRGEDVVRRVRSEERGATEGARENAGDTVSQGRSEGSGASEPVIDRAKLNDLLQMTGGERAFLAEMIDSFLETTPDLLAQLSRSLKQGDAAAFRLAAHTLKSGSADFGAISLSRLCARLEDMGKEGTLEGAADLVVQVEAIYNRVKPALEAVRDQP